MTQKLFQMHQRKMWLIRAALWTWAVFSLTSCRRLAAVMQAQYSHQTDLPSRLGRLKAIRNLWLSQSLVRTHRLCSWTFRRHRITWCPEFLEVWIWARHPKRRPRRRQRSLSSRWIIHLHSATLRNWHRTCTLTSLMGQLASNHQWSEVPSLQSSRRLHLRVIDLSDPPWETLVDPITKHSKLP